MKHSRLIATAGAVLALGFGIGAGALPASAVGNDKAPPPQMPDEPFDPTDGIDDFQVCVPDYEAPGDECPGSGDPGEETPEETPEDTPEDTPRPGTPTFTG